MQETIIKCDKCKCTSENMITFQVPLDYKYSTLKLDFCQRCMIRFFIFLQKGYLSCSVEEYKNIVNDFIIHS